jgi:prophage regulatory protein
MMTRPKKRPKKNRKGARRATPRILRLPEVETLSGLKRSAIYAGAASGTFPKPRKLTATASGWLEDEVHEWIESRPVADGSGEIPARSAAP